MKNKQLLPINAKHYIVVRGDKDAACDGIPAMVDPDEEITERITKAEARSFDPWGSIELPDLHFQNHAANTPDDGGESGPT